MYRFSGLFVVVCTLCVTCLSLQAHVLHQLKFGVFFTKALNPIIRKHMRMRRIQLTMLVNNCDDAL